MADAVERAVEANDLDELVRLVNRLVAAEEWDGVVQLRDRCRAALARGKQLWPAASWAEYRLALDAPGTWAATVLVDGTGSFAPGPLPEVAASTHRWEELAPYAPGGPVASMAAHERVVRGEDLTHDSRVDPMALGVPRRLEVWEPRYAVATYTDEGGDFPRPPLPAARWVELPPPGDEVDDTTAVRALTDLASRWVDGSDGRAHAVAVGGSALDAVAALGPRRVRVGELTGAEVMALMCWAAASGGAHGRRRGAAFGRSAAWWALSALGGLQDRAMEPDAVGEAVAELRWWWWDAGEPDTGWALRLAVEDPEHRLAWALVATDAAL